MVVRFRGACWFAQLGLLLSVAVLLANCSSIQVISPAVETSAMDQTTLGLADLEVGDRIDIVLIHGEQYHGDFIGYDEFSLELRSITVTEVACVVIPLHEIATIGRSHFDLEQTILSLAICCAAGYLLLYLSLSQGGFHSPWG